MSIDIYTAQIQKNHFLYISYLGKKRNKFYVGKHSCSQGINHPVENNYHGSSCNPIFERFVRMFGVKAIQTHIIETCWTEDEVFAREAEIVDWDFIKREDVLNLSRGGKGQKIADWAAQRRWKNPATEFYDIICSMKIKGIFNHDQILATIQKLSLKPIEKKHIECVIKYGMKDGVIPKRDNKTTQRLSGSNREIREHLDEVLEDYRNFIPRRVTAERLTKKIGKPITVKQIGKVLEQCKDDGIIPKLNLSEFQRRKNPLYQEEIYQLIIEMKKQHYFMKDMVKAVSEKLKRKVTRNEVTAVVMSAEKEGLIKKYSISEVAMGQRLHNPMMKHYDLIVERKKQLIHARVVAEELSKLENKTIGYREIESIITYARDNGDLPLLKIGEARRKRGKI